jgi:hypothetical protein
LSDFQKRVSRFREELESVTEELAETARDFIENLSDDELIELNSLAEVIAERDSEIDVFRFLVDWPEMIDQEVIERELEEERAIV